MNKQTLVVGDADSIVARANPNDLKHQEAKKITDRLSDLEAQLIYPVTAVVEAVTFIQRALNSGATAYGTAVEFIESGQVAEVDEEIYSRAVNDFFDASVSKQDGAEAIFSFDKFYQKHGFKLASEL
ncbi:MAG: hypothetical protein UY37_C0004G0067 [Candidatus Beckwithbacteria bacterium GW2011_GWC2_49_11]|nr:MAG: hypothetical protein UY37_C0004G0067 [Candidatus Beckwithbacteria bacterium GW2011_GWC2_49_11]